MALFSFFKEIFFDYARIYDEVVKGVKGTFEARMAVAKKLKKEYEKAIHDHTTCWSDKFVTVLVADIRGIPVKTGVGKRNIPVLTEGVTLSPTCGETRGAASTVFTPGIPVERGTLSLLAFIAAAVLEIFISRVFHRTVWSLFITRE